MTRRAPEAGVTLIEMLVVLAIMGVLAGAALLGVSGTRGSSQADLLALSLKTRLEAAVDFALARDEGFGIWQGDNRLVVLIADDAGLWVPATDPRLNPVKLSRAQARMSFRADDDRVFFVSPGLVPVQRETLEIVLPDGPKLRFDGLKLKHGTDESE